MWGNLANDQTKICGPMHVVIAFALLAAAAAAPAPSNQTDKITNLPGFPGGVTPFDMYRCELEIVCVPNRVVGMFSNG